MRIAKHRESGLPYTEEDYKKEASPAYNLATVILETDQRDSDGTHIRTLRSEVFTDEELKAFTEIITKFIPELAMEIRRNKEKEK